MGQINNKVLERNLNNEKFYDCSKLRKYRKDTGLSRKKVAEATGINEGTLTFYENMNATPNIENAIRLAKFYNVPLESFIVGADEIKINHEPIVKKALHEYRKTMIDKEVSHNAAILPFYPENLICAVFGAREFARQIDNKSYSNLSEYLRTLVEKNKFSRDDEWEILSYFGDPLIYNITKDRLDGINYALSRLRDKERDVIKYRYEKGETLEVVGKRFGVTRERVRQLEVKALRKLRHPNYSKYIRDGLKKSIELDEIRKLEIELYELEQEKKYLKEKINRQRESNDKALEILGEDFKEQWKDSGVPKNLPLWEANLSVRTYNCLNKAGVTYLTDLEKFTEEDLMKIRNLGLSSLTEIKTKLTKHGIHLKESE